MKPASNGLLADVDSASGITHWYICSGCSVLKERQDNKSALLPGGGPGPSSVSSLCHTSSIGKSASQSLNDRVAH